MKQSPEMHAERRGFLPTTAVRRPVTTAMVFIALVALGAVAFSRLAVDLLPSVDFPRISINTEYPGVGPEEIETLITRPVEEGMATIQGVEKIEGFSTEGRSRVTLEFTWGTPLDGALADVRANLERLRGALPEDAEPPVAFKFDLGSFPVMSLSLSGEGMDQRRLRRLAEDRIKHRLERVEGVARVDLRGGLEREVHVNLDVDKLSALGLAPRTIVDVLRAENRDIPGGEVEEGNEDLILKTVGEFPSFESIGDTVVAWRAEGPVRLRDVATIQDATQEQTAFVRIDGREGLRMSVSKLSGANTVAVAERVRAEIERIDDDYPDLRVSVLRDTSEFIEDAVSNVEQGAVIGGMLAVVILFLFLRDWRATLVIATAIPISSIAAFWLMDLGNITLNIISFGGLALGIGMLVDNAIVILENIFRRREEGVSDPADAAIQGSAEVAAAVTASTLTTLAVFVPVVFLGGFPKIFFGQLAMVVAFSLATSLLVALTLVPMLTSRILRKSRPVLAETAGSAAGGAGLARLEQRYGRLVNWALDRKLLLFGVSTLLLAGSCGAVGAGWVATELMPETDQGEVDVSIEMPSGTRLEITEQVVNHVEAIARQVPEAKSIVSVVGSPGSWSSAGTNAGWVELELVELGERERSSADIAEALRKQIGEIPDAKIRVRPGGGFWIFRFLRGGGDRLQVNITGYDLATARELTEQVSDLMRETEGVADVWVSRNEGVGELAVRVDPARAAALGLSHSAVGEAMQTYVLGTTATWLREAGDEYRVLVRLEEDDRRYVEQVLDLPVFLPSGGQVPLRAVADVVRREGPITIEREGQERVVYLTGTLESENTDLGAVARKIEAKIREQVVVPDGFEVYLAGEREQQQETFGNLLMGLALALALVYMVMASQFENLLQPFIIMFSVPFALVGVVVTLLVTGTSFSMNAFLGVIVLVGIVVNNAIVLVDYVNMYRRDRGLSLRDAVVQGATKRLRPILMTTLTTVLALGPVALGVGSGGELNAPLARVVAGGLLFSTLVTLVIVPAAYWGLEARRARRRGEAAVEPKREAIAA